MKVFLEKLNLKKSVKNLNLFITEILQFLFSKTTLFIAFLLVLSVFANFIFIFHPLKGKRWLSKIYKKPIRQTLQIADGPLIGNNMDVRILKVKYENKIYLEFLSKQPDDSYLEINSVQLKGSRDGYFEEYGGKITALLLIDENGDGRLDVIAPTFDNFLIPRTNLVVYNQEIRKFELKSEFAYPETATPDFIAY